MIKMFSFSDLLAKHLIGFMIFKEIVYFKINNKNDVPRLYLNNTSELFY